MDMTGIGKQAKILEVNDVARCLAEIRGRRYPERNEVMFLLSLRQGLRACEIAKITWSMVTRPDGTLDDVIHLRNRATKKKVGGRILPLHRQTKDALVHLKSSLPPSTQPEDPILASQRGGFLKPRAVMMFFIRLYKDLGLEGCSSHSGRRTFATRAVRSIKDAGGTIRDVQLLLGHKSLESTAVYIEQDSDAQRAVMELI
jgi:integrase/recombinase XerD